MRTGAIGACFGVATLVGFRWWERWDREGPLCTGIFSECLGESLGPLVAGVPVLLMSAWLGLLLLRVRRAWLVVLLAVPFNGLVAIALHAVEPRIVVVVATSGAAWAIVGSMTFPGTHEPETPAPVDS